MTDPLRIKYYCYSIFILRENVINKFDKRRQYSLALSCPSLIILFFFRGLFFILLLFSACFILFYPDPTLSNFVCTMHSTNVNYPNFCCSNNTLTQTFNPLTSIHKLTPFLHVYIYACRKFTFEYVDNKFTQL